MTKYLSNTLWLAGLITTMAALPYLREEYRRDPEQFSTLTTISAELTSIAKGDSIDATAQLRFSMTGSPVHQVIYEESTGVTDGRSVVGRNFGRISDAFMTLLGM